MAETTLDQAGAPGLRRAQMAVPRGGLAIPVVLFLLVIAVPFSFGLGGLVLTGARLVLLAMIVPMTVRLIAGRYGPILPTDWLFFLHLLWVAIVMVFHHPAQAVTFVGSTGIEFLGGYLLGRAYVRSRADMEALIRALLVILCATLPLAAFEALTDRPLLSELLRQIPVLSGYPKGYHDLRMGLHRAQVGFFSPIHYGLFAAMALSLCFLGLRGVLRDGTRWLLTGAVLACAFLSLSSGALLPVVIQIFLILWAAMFDRVRRRWLLLVAMLVLAYVAVDLMSNRTPIRVLMSYATFSPHNAFWRAITNEAVMDNIRAHPILGLGLNDWARPEWMPTSSVDNFWLLNALRFGIPGGLTVALGYALALWRIGRRDLGEDTGVLRLRRAWVFTFGSVAFTLYTVHIWAEIYAFVFFMLGAGMWLATTQPGSTGTVAPPVQPTGNGFTRFPAAKRRATDRAPASSRYPAADHRGGTRMGDPDGMHLNLR